MRFAFLTTSCDLFIERMKPLAGALSSHGHSVRVFGFLNEAKEVGYPLNMRDWTTFEVQPIIDHNPDLIIVWNGHFPGMNAVVHYLRVKYPVAVMELGWFTQKTRCYLSDDLAQISKIREVPFSDGVASFSHNKKLLEEARGLYDTTIPKSISLPEKFIFVPRQLEQDTQILITSNIFKTMGSLLGYVRHTNPGMAIVVTNHPVDKHKQNPDFVIDMTDKASSLALALKAEKVIGINSTVLAETMLFGKPTSSLGAHVAAKELFVSTDKMSDWPERYNYRSLVLIYNQWDYKNPPGWLIDKINNLDLTPRIPT